MTTTEDAPVELRLRGDGTGEVIVGGVAEPIRASALRDARKLGLAHVQQLATRRGSAVRFDSYDPEGHWQLMMHPNGQVAEYKLGSASAQPSAPAVPRAAALHLTASRQEPGQPPEGSGDDRWSTVGRSTAPPATIELQLEPTAASASGDADPAPGEPVEPSRRAYDSSYVMGSIVPVTRVPQSTRGIRNLLGIGPSKRELAERADRAATCQTYGRPVTVVVADPRGGSGKTTTSVLLAGAFGTARGGGVLVLENHELRGTMHLRTDSQTKDLTIRHLLLAQQKAATADQVVRLGDLAAYVRHQMSGQYDVLVSATKGDRALARIEFESVHDLGSRFYEVIIVDTANNESAENWQAAIQRADSLVVPLKWRNDYSLPAIEMLEELETSGDPRLESLVRRAVVVASHNHGDLDQRCRQQLLPFFAERTQAVIEIGPDSHIAEGNVIEHDQLAPVTRRHADRLAAEVAKAIQLGLIPPVSPDRAATR